MVLRDDAFDGPAPSQGPMSLEEMFARVSALFVRAGAFLPPVLRAKSVGEMLNVGERAVRKMMDRDELPWAWQGRQRVVLTHLWISMLTEQAKANNPARFG